MEEGMKSDVWTKSQEDRRYFLGGSDARIIMGSDEALLLRLWREKRGEVEPEDLSDNLIVQLGSVTEDLNRRWYERNTGHAIKDVQRRIQHPDPPLHVLDGVAGIALIPAPVEVLGHGPKLDDQIIREILRLDLSALLPPKP